MTTNNDDIDAYDASCDTLQRELQRIVYAYRDAHKTTLRDAYDAIDDACERMRDDVCDATTIDVRNVIDAHARRIDDNTQSFDDAIQTLYNMRDDDDCNDDA